MANPMGDEAVVDPERVQILPRHARDQPLLRDLLCRLTLEQIVLLFFFHLAADKKRCSFSADSTIATRLGLKGGNIAEVRYAFISGGFIAFRYPLFELLLVADRGVR